MDDLLADFLTETTESLSEIDLALVKFERSPDDSATLSQIFRMVHTIKGTCGFLGLPRLEKVAHAAETVLDKLRDHALTVTSAGIGLILNAIDRIKMIVAGLAAHQAEPSGDDSELIAALEALAEGREPHITTMPTAPSDSIPNAAAEAVQAPEAPAPVRAAEPDHAETGSDPTLRNQTIRVGVDVLENLMTLVSELVLTRNQLLQLLRSSENNAFTAPMQRLSHLTSDLQEGVMKTRMQPIGNAWNKLPRLVRDLSHDLGKKIDLVMVGADTELDRQVLEMIKDPLTHMVRNSGDHGLEDPAGRRAAGKPETGTITLEARHEGGHIIIEISDDGRGMHTDRIAARAISQGLATEAQIRTMSDDEIRRFIFHAGFSTAAAVTAISGRGVGMDVVKTNIEQISGTIDLHSVPGQGSRFTIKIPLTLAIVSALIVEASGERFAVPQISVVEIVHAGVQSDMRIETINGTPVLRLRDRLLPLVSLGGMLRLSQGDGARTEETIIVVSLGTATFGLMVDRVFDTEEIVVKPVAPILRQIPLYSGNTILGDGSVIMILDPLGIARAAGIGMGNEMSLQDAAAKTVAEERETTSLLLFQAGPGAPKALPLALVARLEDIPMKQVEQAGGRTVTQYRGQLMPLIALPSQDEAGTRETQPVLVFREGERHVGLTVDRIIDVVDSPLAIEIGGGEPGLLGTAVIAGQATDLVDTSYWLSRASADWFKTASASQRSKARILIVEDSDFFRQLLVPSLTAAGYQVTAAESAAKALALRESGENFDAIVSDIEMPDMDGLAFARTIRSGGPWADVPLLALSGQDKPQQGRDAGFTDYIRKFERDTLLASLEQCLAQPVMAAA